MKKEFADYLSELKISESATAKVEKIFEEVSDLYRMDFQEIFLNSVDKGGITEYISVWLLTDSFVVECKNFLSFSEDDYDLATYKNNISYFNIKKKALNDINKPVDSSTVSVHLQLAKGQMVTCDMFATGLNCRKLVQIAKD